MAWEINSPNTGDTLADMDSNAVRKLWKRGVDIYEQSNDFFSEMEGRNPRSLIQTETDTSKGKGQQITFTVMSGFYSEGKTGDDLFETQDDFEEALISSYDMVVDYLRNAVRYTERTEEKMGMRGELVAGLPQQLGQWMGRMKTERLFKMFEHRGHSSNYVFANGKGSAEELRSADTMGYEDIVMLGTTMKSLGGKPAKVGKMKNGQQLFRQCVVASTDALFSLKQDADYKQLLREAGRDGDANYIWSGGVPDLDGHVIKEYTPIDHDGDGAIGSPLNPKASLGNAIPDSTADTFKAGSFILGGGSAVAAAKTKIKFFKFFPDFDYLFQPADTLGVGSDSFYVLVVNPPGGANGNKIGFYKCNANNGNKITIEERLVPTANAGVDASFSDTVGNVTYNDGDWVGLHTDTHPVGATIVLANSYGVPIGSSLMLGASAARRGYGKHRNRRTTQNHEGGFVRDVFVTSVFGQEPREDRIGRCPGFMHMTHAVQYPGLPIPTNIT